MSTTWNPMKVALALMLVGGGALVTAIIGHSIHMMNTPPLHRDPQSVPSIAAAQDPPRRWADAVQRARQAARDGLAEQSLPGLSVAVGVDGELVWAEGVGFADLDARVPVTPGTRFRIGTASKVLTSAAVGLLLERGRLDLDAPIRTYVPEFPEKPWPVTLRQVMGHLAGLRNDGGDEGPLYGVRCERPVEALRVFADRELLFEPGTRYRYSNFGWILVSAAVENAAGEPLLAFMEKEVFGPLGMDHTAADPVVDATAPAGSPYALPNRATLYFPRFGANPRYGLHLMRPVHLSCYSGAAVFLSTPSDLVRFGLAMQAGKLLQPATLQALQASQRLASGEETGYGLGWDLETVTLLGQPARVVGHDGDSLGGPVASLMVVPERGIVVAVLSNISYADTAGLARKVAEAFAEEM